MLTRRPVLSVVLALVVLTGCFEDPAPLTAPDPDAQTVSVEGSYYYHLDERIPVTIDRTHLIVRTEQGRTISEGRFPDGIRVVGRSGQTSRGLEVFELSRPATAAAEQELRGLAGRFRTFLRSSSRRSGISLRAISGCIHWRTSWSGSRRT
jgi:hypothetical protein